MDAYYAGLEEMRDWDPPKQHSGYPEEYATFGCTASECGPVGEIAKGVREAGVDQIGGARRRKQTRGRRHRQKRRRMTRRRKQRRHH